MFENTVIPGHRRELAEYFENPPTITVSGLPSRLTKSDSYAENNLSLATKSSSVKVRACLSVKSSSNTATSACERLLGFDLERLPDAYQPTAPTRLAGGFLIFNVVAIGSMWLGIVVPPLLDGSVYPPEVQHYTTLIVQGLDLGLLLPLCVVSAILLLRRRPMGYLLAPVYLVFLSLLMTALLAKIIAMGQVGAEIIPAVFIIPTILVVTIGTTIALLRKIA